MTYGRYQGGRAIYYKEYQGSGMGSWRRKPEEGGMRGGGDGALKY